MSSLDDLVRPGGLSRRDFMQRAVAAGLLASPAAGLLAACGGSGSGQQSGSGKTSPSNPFGVDAKAPLEVVIFKGGYGDEYARYDLGLYQKKFPNGAATETGIQQIAQQLQPRFVAGNPPDAIDDSGAFFIQPATLVSQGQLAPIDDLLDAPSFDDPNVKVKDTLIPGSQDGAVFNGKTYAILYALSVYGVWYSKPLLQKQGWEYPKTWDEMLKLCGQIKKAGMAPWTYQGKFPQYVALLWHSMVQKHAGTDVIKNIDNLQPKAWSQPGVLDTLEALYQLADKGYVMDGTAGLTHTQAQAAWLQGQAVFIPCGSWLENEEKGLVPSGFDMVVAPTPSGSKSEKLPFDSVNAYGGEYFVVPAHAKNVAGGKEYLRIMLSKDATRKFAELNHALTVVKDSTKGMDLGTAVSSTQALIAKNAPVVPVAQYRNWYKTLDDEVNNAFGAMMTKQIQPRELMARAQAKADAVAQDSSIKKYHR
jgi:N-acetylglucosamine transport system substrate-binding protein